MMGDFDSILDLFSIVMRLLFKSYLADIIWHHASWREGGLSHYSQVGIEVHIPHVLYWYHWEWREEGVSLHLDKGED